MRRVTSILATLLAAVVAGCASNESAGRVGRDEASPPASPGGVGPISATDPCAMRLHDLSGGFAVFIQMNARLPESLDELTQVTFFDLPPATCPTSGKPYVYRPTGIYLAELGEQVILYDPAPSHGGRRLAVTIAEPTEPGGAVVTDVIPLPERFFLLNPTPTAATPTTPTATP